MIAATFHSPNYSPPSYDFDTIEVFPSLEEVIEALFDRYSSNGKRTCTATYLDGTISETFWPNVEAGATLTCYLLTADPDPNERRSKVTGLTEGMVLDAHTAVHGGWKDYTVTLVESEEGSLVAMVERAGI